MKSFYKYFGCGLVLTFAILFSFSLSANQTLNDTKGLDDSVSVQLKALFERYEAKDTNGFMKHVSRKFRGKKGYDYKDFKSSLRYDFRNFDAIEVRIIAIKSIHTAKKKSGRVVAKVSWEKKGTLAISFERWVTSGNTTFVFEETGRTGSHGGPEVKLVRMGGDPVFGLTNYRNLVVMSQGELEGEELTVPAFARKGTIDHSESTTNGTATITFGVNAFDFDSRKLINAVASGDITAGVVMITANGSASIDNLGGVSFNGLDEVDDVSGGGYGAADAYAVGDIFAVYTGTRYAKIRIQSTTATTVTFRYVTQQRPNIPFF